MIIGGAIAQTKTITPAIQPVLSVVTAIPDSSSTTKSSNILQQSNDGNKDVMTGYIDGVYYSRIPKSVWDELLNKYVEKSKQGYNDILSKQKKEAEQRDLQYRRSLVESEIRRVVAEIDSAQSSCQSANENKQNCLINANSKYATITSSECDARYNPRIQEAFNREHTLRAELSQLNNKLWSIK